MPKTPKEKNINIYTAARLASGLTREQASEMLEFVSSDRLYRIESGDSIPHPEEVLAMQRCYKNALLCNQYCTKECAIGQEYQPELSVKHLPQITLEIVDTINSLETQKNRLIEITTDSSIQEEEMLDFISIRKDLQRISEACDSLKLWVENKKLLGELNYDETIDG